MFGEQQVRRARWILPIESPPIHDGLLVVRQGWIESCGPTPADQRHLPLEEVVILPQFVNAHTHLEFSSLPSPLGVPGLPFTSWIPQVMAWRRERDLDETTARQKRVVALRSGIAECQRGQIAAIGEIATSPDSADELAAAGLAGVVFLEFIGLVEPRVATLRELAVVEAAVRHSNSQFPQRGFSPHAPYTVHRDLLETLVRLSRESAIPLAMHLAETRAELELISQRSGPFATLLRDLGVWNPTAYAGFSQPLDYLHLLAESHRALVVHGNYLSAEERRFLATRSDRLSLVYCPRTHAYFQHEPYPLRQLLDDNVRVALGTDSRASNPDLHLLEEVRTILVRHSDVSPAEVLRLATWNGAVGLGLEEQFGSLRPGKRAALQVWNLDVDQRHDPYGWITQSNRLDSSP